LVRSVLVMLLFTFFCLIRLGRRTMGNIHNDNVPCVVSGVRRSRPLLHRAAAVRSVGFPYSSMGKLADTLGGLCEAAIVDNEAYNLINARARLQIRKDERPLHAHP
jgi:hypothetical protein